jgi:hypothetical protein
MTLKPLLLDLVNRGKPLADLIIKVNNPDEIQRVIVFLNNLSDYIYASRDPNYSSAIKLYVTREACSRLFSLTIYRKLIDANEPRIGFKWEEKGEFIMPKAISDLAEYAGISQPCDIDDSQDDDVCYDA